jgi:hypothetical protein
VVKTVVAGALGECAHVAGVIRFLWLAEAAGWQEEQRIADLGTVPQGADSGEPRRWVSPGTESAGDTIEAEGGI